MEWFKSEYVSLYEVEPSMGEPLRGQMGDMFGIPNDIPLDMEVHKALSLM